MLLLFVTEWQRTGGVALLYFAATLMSLLLMPPMANSIMVMTGRQLP